MAIWLWKIALAFRAQIAAGYRRVAVTTFWRKCQRVMSAAVFLVVVFDGKEPRTFDGKDAEHARRKGTHEKGIAKALRLKNADALLKAKVAISDELVAGVISMLREKDVTYIVAPYEADVQMVLQVSDFKAC